MENILQSEDSRPTPAGSEAGRASFAAVGEAGLYLMDMLANLEGAEHTVVEQAVQQEAQKKIGQIKRLMDQ